MLIVLVNISQTSDLEAVMENGMLSVSWPRSPLARIFGESTNTPTAAHGSSVEKDTAGLRGEKSTSSMSA